MSDEDLFVIIRAIVWFNPQLQMPSDEDIKKFIENAKERFKEVRKYEN